MTSQRGGVGGGVVNGYLYALGGHDAPASNPLASRFDSVERLVNNTGHPVSCRNEISVYRILMFILQSGDHDLISFHTNHVYLFLLTPFPYSHFL
jgi:hypothetical protein